MRTRCAGGRFPLSFRSPFRLCGWLRLLGLVLLCIICFVVIRVAIGSRRSLASVDHDYRQALKNNDVGEFLRIIDGEYAFLGDYPQDVRSGFAGILTDRLESDRPERIAFREYASEMINCYRKGGNGYVRSYHERLRLRDANWRADLWGYVSNCLDDADKELFGHPRLLEAALDRWTECQTRLHVEWPNLQSGCFSYFDPEIRYISMEDRTAWMRSKLLERQMRIGEAVDQLMKFRTDDFMFGPLQNAVAYAISGERDPLQADPFDSDEVLDRYARNDPSNLYVIRAKGLTLWKRSEYESAEVLLRRSAAEFENDPLGRFAWASCMQALNIPFDPETVMGTIRKDHPQFRTQESRRLSWLATLQERSGNFLDAYSNAYFATSLNSNEKIGWEILARFDRRKQNLVEAEHAERRIADIAEAHEKLRNALRETTEATRDLSGLIEIHRCRVNENRDETLWADRPEDKEFHRLAQIWIDAAKSADWYALAEFWKTRRDDPDFLHSIPKLRQLAEKPEFEHDAFFFPRPTLRKPDPSTSWRFVSWIYGN